MLRLFAAAVIVAATLSSGSAGAKRPPTIAVHDKADTQKPVPPTHVVIDPPLPAPGSSRQGPDAPNQPEQNTVRWFLRADYLIVWVTIAYALISGWTLLVIKAQAKTMEAQATDAKTNSAAAALVAQKTLNAIALQAEHAGESATAAQLSWRLALEQLEVIRAQVDEMKAQTAVAKTSADAALLNARALIHSERPWIYPTMTINGPLTHDTSGPRLAVRVKLDNLGSTPAVGIVFEPRMYVLHVLKPNATDERKKMLDDLMNRTPVINSIAFPGHPLVFGYSIPLTTEDVEKHEIKAGGVYVASVILGVVYRHTLDKEARYCTGAIYRLSKPLEKGGALFEIGKDVPQQDLALELDTVFPLVVE